MLIERHFGLSETEAMKVVDQVSLDNFQLLVGKITELKKYLDKNYKQIHSRSDFALKSMENYLKEIN
ncbi:hypothetical protein ACILDU_04625 [Capnocytophaga canimorsus]|uniref:hypothetical protein n=1 Tax=Capnocytophaga canimorsus TaxID=28188 RepID=UPI00249B6BBD|nr:hypothetical protein [Capnocytophaga canimorsus]WGU68098.1 hypothetical protein QIU19_12315 [Capnocytophaga canimorsus]WGU70795.1 hypothetical protein QIU18_01485 [Capnocytophaga canimorsus]